MLRWIPKGIKDLLKRTGRWHRHVEERVYPNWTLSGKPMPPHAAVKYRIIRAHAKKFKTPMFIETETYRGETLQAGSVCSKGTGAKYFLRS